MCGLGLENCPWLGSEKEFDSQRCWDFRPLGSPGDAPFFWVNQIRLESRNRDHVSKARSFIGCPKGSLRACPYSLPLNITLKNCGQSGVARLGYNCQYLFLDKFFLIAIGFTTFSLDSFGTFWFKQHFNRCCFLHQPFLILCICQFKLSFASNHPAPTSTKWPNGCRYLTLRPFICSTSSTKS